MTPKEWLLYTNTSTPSKVVESLKKASAMLRSSEAVASYDVELDFFTVKLDDDIAVVTMEAAGDGTFIGMWDNIRKQVACAEAQ